MARFWKGESQPNANIHFSKASGQSSEPQRWFTDDDIDGKATFRLRDGTRIQKSRVTLSGQQHLQPCQDSLANSREGSVSTMVSLSGKGSMQPRWRTKSCKFLSMTQEKIPRADDKSDDGSLYSSHFHFNIAESLPQQRLFHDLPPSTDLEENGRNWRDLTNNEGDIRYHVTYTVSASAFTERGIAATTSRDIAVIPTAEAQPPVASADFPSEYILSARSKAGSRLSFKKPIEPEIEIAGDEPDPITIRTDDNGSSGGASTTVNLVARISRGAGAVLVDSAMLPRQCQLKASLNGKTLITSSVPDRGGIPTLEQARYSDDADVRISKSHVQEYAVAVSDWIRCSFDSDPSTFNVDDSFLATIPFKFAMRGEKMPLPTFNTPLLCRRYAVDLSLTFRDISRQTLTLSLPVQILHQKAVSCTKKNACV